MRKKKLRLCIAGDFFVVLFDGKRVTSPDFPDQEISYTAPCGTKVTQELLVQICKTKVAKDWTDSIIKNS